MPHRIASSREELISLQRLIVRRLREEIYGSFELFSEDGGSYQREYERSLGAGFSRAITRHSFLSRLARSDLVFQGEFHTLRECQRAALSIVTELNRRRPLVIMTEVVPISGQRALDAYTSGEIDEDTFLEAINYRSSWGFSWRNYRPLFLFARENEVQVYAMSSPSTKGDIRSRDALSADIIARASLAHPNSTVYAIAGDFRVSRGHLPRAVAARLRNEGVKRRSVVVHQNIDSLYWELASQRREERWPVLELEKDEYCIMSSTPLSKYQSYLHWELDQEVLAAGGDGLGGASSDSHVKEAVGGLVRAIARFLRIDPAGFDDFRVYTTRNLDFLEDLRRERRFTEREIREIKRQILNDESYFISRGNIIYLSSLSIDHASEEAAHYLNNKLSGHVPRPLPARSDFYSRIIREALGFFGSKVINSSRSPHSEEDFREILSYRGRGPRNPSLAQLLKLARLVVSHLEMERSFLRSGRRPHLEAIYEQELDLHLGITHSLGYILGDKVYRGIADGALKRSEVRDLFRLSLEEHDDAEVIYFDLVRRLSCSP